MRKESEREKVEREWDRERIELEWKSVDGRKKVGVKASGRKRKLE